MCTFGDDYGNRSQQNRRAVVAEKSFCSVFIVFYALVKSVIRRYSVRIGALIGVQIRGGGIYETFFDNSIAVISVVFATAVRGVQQ